MVKNPTAVRIEETFPMERWETMRAFLSEYYRPDLALCSRNIFEWQYLAKPGVANMFCAWEGETLVVETAGFNERTFLDATGLPHSDAMRTIERIRKTAKELEIVITIHDPEMYERDWQARFVYQERNDVRIEEYACNDNHRDLSAVNGVEPQ